MSEWIRIHRHITEWRWYDDSLTVHLFLHFIINAGEQAGDWHDITLGRGQLVTSIATLSRELNTTPQKIRARLDRLQADGVILLDTTNRYTIVTVCDFDTYQENHKQLPVCTHKDYIEDLMRDRTWGEVIAMRHHLTSLDELDRWLQAFSLDYKSRGITHRDANDAKRHFNDWLRIQLQRTKQNENSQQDRRRGAEITASSAEDYTTSF